VSVTPNFPQLLHTYFHEWLTAQRNVSRHTLLSYRDTWRLFLQFVAQQQKRPVAALSFSHLTAETILSFLSHLEHQRRVSIHTRNCRLAALRSFFAFVADREPLLLAHCAAVLRIPTKRAPQRAVSYLDREELTVILAQPDRTTLEGQRDHALLSLLYNTGARIQELLNLCPKDVRLEKPSQVRLYGKGRKERLCPLWPETAALLTALLRRRPRGPDEPLFVNRYGHPLGASGVRFQLRRYLTAAARQLPTLPHKHVTPHTFRHTAAVHLVSAGVDVTVIRSWLGHASLDTTNQYARASLETRREALEQIAEQSGIGQPPAWKREDALLAWLEAL
jgi:site-specific recombinase XerD